MTSIFLEKNPETRSQPKSIVCKNKKNELLCTIYCDGQIEPKSNNLYPSEIKEIVTVADNFFLFYSNIKNEEEKISINIYKKLFIGDYTNETSGRHLAIWEEGILEGGYGHPVCLISPKSLETEKDYSNAEKLVAAFNNTYGEGINPEAVKNMATTLHSLRDAIKEAFPDMVDDPETVQHEWIQMINNTLI